MSEGKYQHKPDLPFTPGLEAAGEVIDVGDGVKSASRRVIGSWDFLIWALSPKRPLSASNF